MDLLARNRTIILYTLIDWMYRLGSVNLTGLLRNGWGLERANIYLLR